MPSNSVFVTALEGTIVSQITAAATTATVKVKEINGVTPTWPTGAHRLTIVQKSRTTTKVEVIDVTSASQSGSTVTLTIATRGLPLDGTGFSGTGTAQVFTSGAKVIITWDAQSGRQTMFKDIVNTVTGSGAIRGSSTTVPLLRSNSMTTAQRTAVTAGNGDEVYDSDLGQKYDYVGGAWAARASGTNPNAANNTAGKVDIATAAENAAGTATDATSGALNVIPTSIVKATSSGAVNGTVPMLNAAVALDASIGGTGVVSPTSGSVYIGAGSSAMTAVAPTANTFLGGNGTTWSATTGVPILKYVNTASSTDITGGGTGDQAFSTAYTIPANDLAIGVVYEVEASGAIDGGVSNRVLALKLRYGTTALLTFDALTPTTAGTLRYWFLKARFVCRTTGATGTVFPDGNVFVQSTASTAQVQSNIGVAAAVTIDTTASTSLNITQAWNVDDGTKHCYVQNMTVTRIST